MEKRKALVVDDVLLNRTAVAGFLITKGFQVDQCEDGLKGFKIIQKNKFDVIFLDIEMPNMNGFELLSLIRKSVVNDDTPIIMLSTKDKPEDIEKAKKLGANHYIVKPFTFDKMFEGLKVTGMI
jgi:CheY-like chemotaxis protein